MSQSRNAKGFVFTRDGVPIGDPARTFKEFVIALEQLPLASVEGHVRRGDFSRWVADVFGESSLSRRNRQSGKQMPNGEAANDSELLLKIIRERHEV